MWGLLASQQSMVFGVEEAQGYNPVQLPRFWTFVRASDPKAITYSRAWFLRPLPVALDVLQVRWVITSSRRWLPSVDADLTAREGRWQLLRLPAAPPRASLVTSWWVAEDERDARRRVTGPGFDPATTVVLEEDPGSKTSGRQNGAEGELQVDVHQDRSGRRDDPRSGHARGPKRLRPELARHGG